jgi:two-component system, sensor histidine kinase and response regulator
VEADKNHISLVLRNLLNNAIKFTSDGGHVKIQSHECDGELEISVSDSGIGIGLEDLNKLFNVQTHFTRRGTREEKGLGIGLLLTKEFVECNGGSIWVSSELGKGSTFTFTVKKDTTDERVRMLDSALT